MKKNGPVVQHTNFVEKDYSVRPVDVAILYAHGQKDRAQHIAYLLHPEFDPTYIEPSWEKAEVEEWLEGQTVSKGPNMLPEFEGEAILGGERVSKGARRGEGPGLIDLIRKFFNR